MKCKHCNGTGATNWYVNRAFVTCPYCGGTGEREVEQTEQEYIQTCTMEQLAEVLSNISTDAWVAGLNNMDRPVGQKDNWQQRLKQPHINKE